MGLQTDLIEQAILSLATQVIAEDPGTANHLKRLKVTKMLTEDRCICFQFVYNDLVRRGISDSSTVAQCKNKLDIIVDILVGLGYGD